MAMAMAMAMASEYSACAKLSNRFLLLSRFQHPSPPQPPDAAVCESRIRLTRIKIKPRPSAAVLSKRSSFSVNNSNEKVQQVPALSASNIIFAMMRIMPPVAGFLLLASFICQSVGPLLFVSDVLLISLPTLAVLFQLIERIHEFTSSVIKLQVGFSGSGSSRIQMNLTQTAKFADTSGSHAEIALNLLQNIDFCNSGYSSVDVKLNFDEWKKRFKLLSVEEQCKFDEDATLVNMNGIWTSNTRSTEFPDKNIVVTVLIAAKGVHKLPSINGTSYMKEALQKIACVPANQILTVEVFWTLQNENDMQWEQKLLKDFPLLRAL